MKPNRLTLATVPMLAAAALLAGCERNAPEPEPVPSTTPTVQPSQSIIRDGFDEPIAEQVLEPLEVTIGFPEGGSELDEAAVAALEELAGSDQAEAGWPIVLRSHSDAGGNDAANLRASRARGDAVRAWLVEQGFEEDRIAVIAFGEQNPVQPNALPDGTPNEDGRAANRRVDVTIADPDAGAEDGTAVEEPASEAEPAG